MSFFRENFWPKEIFNEGHFRHENDKGYNSAFRLDNRPCEKVKSSAVLGAGVWSEHAGIQGWESRNARHSPKRESPISKYARPSHLPSRKHPATGGAISQHPFTHLAEEDRRKYDQWVPPFLLKPFFAKAAFLTGFPLESAKQLWTWVRDFGRRKLSQKEPQNRIPNQSDWEPSLTKFLTTVKNMAH